jgi:hypothetical protein
LNLLPLHKLIAGRGDGLHPHLVYLLEARAKSAADPAIKELALHRADPHIQAGPHPTRSAGAQLPKGVVRFAPRSAEARRHGRSKSAR